MLVARIDPILSLSELRRYRSNGPKDNCWEDES